jgi:protease-4
MADPDSSAAVAGRIAVGLIGTVVATAAGYLLFVVLPDTVTVLGVLLAVVAAFLGVQLSGSLARSVFPGYNVAEVAVEGPISRDGSLGPLPTSRGTPADDIVEQIERADADDSAEALMLKLNTPGGEVVPSEDIRAAAADFDGPTVAYATDTCASGGYWIASGCDEIWAREASVVGSIGVIGSRVNAKELADRIGVSYERFAAGQYKDAGTPLKEIDEDERDYLQGLIDDYYEDFVERVAEGRGIDPATVRGTEARVYLGEEAHELGLVDELGDREAVLDRVAAELGTDTFPQEFEPQQGLRDRVGAGARGLAYAAGAGVASAVGVDEEEPLRLRT